MVVQMLNVDTLISSDVLTVSSQYFEFNGKKVLARQRFYNLDGNVCFGVVVKISENDYMAIIPASDRSSQTSEDFTNFQDALVSILPFDLRSKVFPERYTNHGK